MAPVKTFLTDDKDALWDCNRAQMNALREGKGGEILQTRVRIENDALKLNVPSETAIRES
jgi:hypothetical protein